MTGVEMELLRDLMHKAERNQMMTQTLSVHQLEHKNVQDARQAEWNAQRAAGQWPGYAMQGKGAALPPKSVNPPASSGRPPKGNYDPDDDPWAAENQQGAVPKADPPILQIFGNVQQGTPPSNLPPAACSHRQVWISRSLSCCNGDRIEVSSCKGRCCREFSSTTVAHSKANRAEQSSQEFNSYNCRGTGRGWQCWRSHG